LKIGSYFESTTRSAFSRVISAVLPCGDSFKILHAASCVFPRLNVIRRTKAVTAVIDQVASRARVICRLHIAIALTTFDGYSLRAAASKRHRPDRHETSILCVNLQLLCIRSYNHHKRQQSSSTNWPYTSDSRSNRSATREEGIQASGTSLISCLGTSAVASTTGHNKP
jgi:hypothetical protein